MALLLWPMAVAAQIPGVNPVGYTDLDIDQLYGEVVSVRERTFGAKMERRVVMEDMFIACTERNYDERGNVVSDVAYDADDLIITTTIYQYSDGLKSVTMTRNAAGTPTLQTIYTMDADSMCISMRFTDAIGVTISTSEIVRDGNESTVYEQFSDGERVSTEYYYNSSKRLSKKVVTVFERIGDMGDVKSTTSLSLDRNGHPSKAVVKDGSGKITYTYEYEVDEKKNWTKRVTFKDGMPVEMAYRTLEYL